MGDGLHQAEHFRNALDRERRLRVAGFENLALGAAHGNTQLVSRYVCQCGDVIRDLAPTKQWSDLIEDFAQQLLHADSKK